MNRIWVLSLALAMLMCCVGCGSADPGTETVVDVNETQLLETVTQEPTETEAVEETPEEFVKTNLGGGAKEDVYFPEVYDLRMYAPKNGNTRFEIDFKAPEGLSIVAVAFVGEDFAKTPEGWSPDPVVCAGDGQQAAYRYEAEEKTNGAEQTFVFEIETELLDQSNGVEVHFCDENYESMSWLLVYHTQYDNQVTNGTPVGDIQVLETSVQGDVEAHSVTMQSLDNGYVRFVIDYTAPEKLWGAFLNAPNGDRFVRYGFYTTSDREAIVVDIAQDKLEGQKEAIVAFYEYFWEIFQEDGCKIFIEGIG